jgi:peptidylprolyl isomerase
MMKLYRNLTLLGLLAITSQAYAVIGEAQTMPQEQTQEISKEDIKKISEAFGHFIGRNLNTPGVNFDVESVITGIRNGVAGKPAPMSDKEYEEKMLLLQKVAFSKLSDINLKAATEFMEKNVKEKGVIVVEPGKLQYMIIEQGNGPAVESNGSPLINYTGKYLDGTVFGSSVDAGGPITIPLDQTIPGFSKGIAGMKEGEKRRLFVHPDLGYGTMSHLPPNSLLIFDIEVLKAHSPKTGMEDDEDDLLPLALEDDDSDSHHDEDAKKNSKK